MQPDQAMAAPDNNQDLIEKNEHVIVIVRKHWAGIAVIYAMAALFIFSLVVIAIYVTPNLELSHQALALLTLVGLAVVGFLALILFVMAYIYRQSHLTLTDKSCVQVTQRNLFNKKTSRLSMSNVEDVNVEQRGLISSLFNYGTLTIQTAGEEDNFVFTFCPNPNRYAEQILEARQSYAQHHPIG
jgi:hypothetical protein